MNIMQHIKYDLTRIFRSPLGYLGFIIALLPSLGIIASVQFLDGPFDARVVLSIFLVLGGLVLLMFCLKTIVRDYQYGTIQLFLNSETNRVKYLFGKFCTVIGIIIIFTLLGWAVTLISTPLVGFGELEYQDLFIMSGELLLITLFYITLINILNILVGKPVLVYTTTILIVILSPTLFGVLSLIPKYGQKIAEWMEYNPFHFLASILNQGVLRMESSQVWITIVCIIVFSIVNIILIRKKNI